MAPPGRRRYSKLSRIFLPLALLLLFSSIASAASAVLGIDLGTEYLEAALVKPGIPLEIVLTKDSKRKEAATVAFKPTRLQSSDPDSFPERLYGGDAIAVSARFPGDVYANLKGLLGLDYDNTVVGEYKERYPGLDFVATKRGDGQGMGTVGLRSETLGKKEEPFLVEEILAMELKNIRANAEALAGKGSIVTDAVITIPAFYTVQERRAVELAAELAGIKLLGLMSDGLAVGLNYATSRNFPSISEGAKPEYHLVYDMGAGSTAATVLRFQGRTVKDVGRFNKTVQEVQVLGTASDRTFGGDTLNQLIVDDMIKQFLDTKRLKALDVKSEHVKSHGKTMAKLWKEAERIRQVLSANTNTQASFEGLYYEDVNFKYKLSRNEFDELAAGHISRVSAPLLQALDTAKVSLDELESIVLYGGAVRTPFVQKQLETVAGGSKKIRSNVNADEAAVFGAAFKAAGISPSFKVKDIRPIDIPGFGVSLKWLSEGKERQQKLFTPTSQIGAAKDVPFKNLEDFTLEFIELASGTEEGKAFPIAKVETKNLTTSVAKLSDKFGCAASNVSTMFTIRLSPINGLPEIVHATVSCEVEGTKKGGVIDDVKGLFGFGSKKADQEPLIEDELVDSTSSSVDSSSGTSTTPATPSSASASKKAEKEPKDLRARIETIPIAFDVTPLGVTAPEKAELRRIKDRLAAFDSSDRARILRAEALNTLEAFTYRARDLVSDESFIRASTDSARATLEQKLSAASEWLYGEGTDAKLAEFKEKLRELRELVDPITKRREEASKRPDAVQNLREKLDQANSFIKMMEGDVERAAAESSSSAAEAASSSTSSAPDTSSTPEADFDDLDDDPYAGSSSTTSEMPKPSSMPAMYTPEDLSTLSNSYTTISKWLDEHLARQDKLSPSDDPAIIVTEIEAKAKELQDTQMTMLTKKIRGIPGGGPKPPKPSKSKKSSKTGKKSQTGEASSSTGTVTATSSKKDEL